MSLNKILKSYLAIAAVAVFAFSVLLVPTADAATSSDTKKDDTHYVDLIKNTNKDNPLNKQGTKQALERMRECNKKAKKEDNKITLAEWSACLDYKVKARGEQCDKYNNAREKNTCKLEVAKLTAAANDARDKMKAVQAAKAPPKDYQTCMVRYVKATNTDGVKKSATKAIDNRIERISKLQAKANLIPDTGTNIREKTQQELKSNLDQLNADKATLSSEKAVPADIARVYCGTLFRLQITTHLNQKVLALIALSKGLKADTNIMHVKDSAKENDKDGLFVQPVNLTTHSTIKNNPLKADIESRLNAARLKTADNMNKGNALLKEVQEAKIEKTGTGDQTNYQSTMPKDLVPRVKAIQAQRASAWRNYNEAQVLRNTPKYFGIDVRQNLSSVTGVRLLNANGNILKTDEGGATTVIVTPKNVLAAKKTQIANEQKEKCSNIKEKEEKQSCRLKIEEAIMGQEGDGQAEKGSTVPMTAYIKVKMGSKDDVAKLKRASPTAQWRPASN